MKKFILLKDNYFSAEHGDYILLFGVFTLLLAVLFVAVTLYQRRHGGDAEVVSCEPVPGTKNNQELEESDLPPSYSRLHSGLFSLNLEDHLVPPPPYTTVLYQLGSQLADRIWRSQQQEQVDTSWQQDITSQHQADTSWQHDRTSQQQSCHSCQHSNISHCQPLQICTSQQQSYSGQQQSDSCQHQVNTSQQQHSLTNRQQWASNQQHPVDGRSGQHNQQRLDYSSQQYNNNNNNNNNNVNNSQSPLCTSPQHLNPCQQKHVYTSQLSADCLLPPDDSF